MSIDSVDVRVECDECGMSEMFDDIPVPGGFLDGRTLNRELDKYGWDVMGNRHVCPECVAEAEENLDEDEEEVET